LSNLETRVDFPRITPQCSPVARYVLTLPKGKPTPCNQPRNRHITPADAIRAAAKGTQPAGQPVLTRKTLSVQTRIPGWPAMRRGRDSFCTMNREMWIRSLWALTESGEFELEDAVRKIMNPSFVDEIVKRIYVKHAETYRIVKFKSSEVAMLVIATINWKFVRYSRK